MRPLSGLSLEYNYSIKKLKESSTNYTGNQDKWIILYKPINYKNFNVNISFSQEANWGYGFNDIERDLLIQTSVEVVDLSIAQRNDKILLGSVNVNVRIPLDNIRYLEEFIITGEGYIKKVTDQYNNENEITITGFLFKTSIML